MLPFFFFFPMFQSGPLPLVTQSNINLDHVWLRAAVKLTSTLEKRHWWNKVSVMKRPCILRLKLFGTFWIKKQKLYCWSPDIGSKWGFQSSAAVLTRSTKVSWIVECQIKCRNIARNTALHFRDCILNLSIYTNCIFWLMTGWLVCLQTNNWNGKGSPFVNWIQSSPKSGNWVTHESRILNSVCFQLLPKMNLFSLPSVSFFSKWKWSPDFQDIPWVYNFPILMFTDSFLLLSCFITWSERKKLRSYKLQRSPMNLEISQGAAFLLSGFCLWVLPRYWATQELHLPLCRRDLTLCKDGKFHQITCH